tara:strand:+ start:1685 stop:1948 length:264 start_codon:yes stop_codon:yes gene_type:complete
MSKKILIVDKIFEEDNNIENGVVPFPSFDYQTNWSLHFHDHTKKHHAIAKIGGELASFFTKEVYNPALDCKKSACERLFLNYVKVVL